jgi:CHAT domain-containing protein
MPDISSLEIRLLAQQGKAYPVEMTLAATQQVFRGQVSADIAAWTPAGDSRADGQALFDALFASPDLMRGWGAAHSKANQVRVQLRIDAAELHTLPWELLRDDQDLLAADADSPFSRYLAVSCEWGAAIADRPIRVLAAISNPTDLAEKYGLPPADVEVETQTLRSALGTEAQLTVLTAPVTLDRLEAELRNGYHVLHFVGHGAFNTRSQQAALYFQDTAGNAERISDDNFAGMLNRLASPPCLVVLAACQSARQSMKAAFSGLGPQLVQIGVPAVVAMQENVTMLTARQFAATFYRRLLTHGTVDLAMNEARGTLITNGRYDAAVPVLFMRLPDGRLWGGEKSSKQKSAQSTVFTQHITNVSGGVAIGGKAQDNIIITGSNISGDVVGGDKVMGDKIGKQINTQGGAYVGGDVNVSGGKFVGRDDVSRNVSRSTEDTRSRLSPDGQMVAGLLEDYFDEDELRDVGYQLKCDWDRLGGNNRHAKVGAMVEYCERRDIVPQLKAVMRLARPQLRRQLK